eukprot:116299-Rhodomonas_salina.1
MRQLQSRWSSGQQAAGARRLDGRQVEESLARKHSCWDDVHESCGFVHLISQAYQVGLNSRAELIECGDRTWMTLSLVSCFSAAASWYQHSRRQHPTARLETARAKGCRCECARDQVHNGGCVGQ